MEKTRSHLTGSLRIYQKPRLSTHGSLTTLTITATDTGTQIITLVPVLSLTTLDFHTQAMVAMLKTPATAIMPMALPRNLNRNATASLSVTTTTLRDTTAR